MLTAFYKSKLGLVIETFVLTIFPLILLNLYPDLRASRTLMMFCGLSYVALFVFSQKISRRNFGCRLDNFFLAVKSILPPTVLAIVVTAVLFYFFRTFISIPLLVEEIHRRPSFFIVMLRYFFISVPLQEIIYRSYLINRANLVFPNKLFIKSFSAVIFMLVHTPVHNIILNLGTLILGWLWAANFLKYKNIFSIIISHTLIGLVYLFLMVF